MGTFSRPPRLLTRKPATDCTASLQSCQQIAWSGGLASTQQSIPRHGRIDKDAPGLDAACERMRLREAVGLEDRRPGQAPDPVMTVHDNRRPGRRFDLADPLRKLAQRDQDAVR